MALSGKTITVLGAGIGGLAAAVALAQRGARVTVLERAPEITEVGAGLQITPNGSAVMRALGLGAHLARVSVPLQGVDLRNQSGGLVASIDMSRPTHANTAPWCAVHRADLIDVLAVAARRAGVAVMTGREVEGIAIGFDQISLPMTSGAVRTAKILIGADGVRSIVRPAVNVGARGKDKPVFTGQVAWRALIESRHVPIWNPERRATIYMGPGRHAVTYPLRGGKLMNVVAVEERDEWTADDWNVEDDPMNLLQAFAGFTPELRKLLYLAQDVHLWGLHKHPVAKDWYQSGAVLLGDAAHATLPFMAQGANMALEDAWVLAEELDRHDDFQDGVEAYRARRAPRVRKIVDAATGNARNYHLRSRVVRSVAHWGLGQVSRRRPERLQARYDWIFGEDVTGGAGLTGPDVDAQAASSIQTGT